MVECTVHLFLWLAAELATTSRAATAHARMYPLEYLAHVQGDHQGTRANRYQLVIEPLEESPIAASLKARIGSGANIVNQPAEPEGED